MHHKLASNDDWITNFKKFNQHNKNSMVIRIGSLYYLSSILMLSDSKKMEESTYMVVLMAGPSLQKWGLKPSEAILRHEKTFFRVKNFSS
jgi:hypothetical protein